MRQKSAWMPVVGVLGLLVVGLAAGGGGVVLAPVIEPPLADGVSRTDELTMAAAKNLLEDYPAVNPDGTVNFVTEIPTGSNAKWEIKDDGKLHWDMKKGKPRVVKYLSYVGDYGIVPRTRQGDGDAIDVLVLAPPFPRGSVVAVNVIGVIKLTDEGEQDNKLLAVVPETPLGDVASLEDLDARYPGVSDIIKTWFQNYKGPGSEMVIQGMGDRDEAMALLADAEKQIAQSSS